jgi:hypothetical protein
MQTTVAVGMKEVGERNNSFAKFSGFMEWKARKKAS